MDKKPKGHLGKIIPVKLPPPIPGSTANGWNEYSRLVLNELERLNENYEKLEAGVIEIKVDIAKLQVKSGVWGLAGGAISVLITILFLVLRRGMIL